MARPSYVSGWVGAGLGQGGRVGLALGGVAGESLDYSDTV